MRTKFIVLMAGLVACVFIADAPKAWSAGTLVYAFCSKPDCADGKWPMGGVLDVKGALYGTTSEGGASCNCGVVFSVNPETKAKDEKVLYSFCSQQNCTDGSTPEAGVIEVNGLLYGTTVYGGTGTNCAGATCGTVFSVNPKTGAESVVHSFCDPAHYTQTTCYDADTNQNDGYTPAAGLLYVDGTLYGTTNSGGTGCGDGNCGTVFAIDLATGSEKIIYTFAEGSSPSSSLIYLNGNLYGTTEAGGNVLGGKGSCTFEVGCGTVFSINVSTGAETTLYAFCSLGACADGEAPAGEVIAIGNKLYGTTIAGGAPQGFGTVFSLDLKTGAETVLHSFQSGSDGSDPSSGLLDVGGTLYGVTSAGGSDTSGTMYSINPKTGAEAVVYSFATKTGRAPTGTLIDVKDLLYGTATFGGGKDLDSGTVFRLAP